MFYLTYRGISWARKSFEKTTGQGTFWPDRKNGGNHGSAILGVKKGEIQKFFFLQFSKFLGPIDGTDNIFLSGAPFWLYSET